MDYETAKRMYDTMTAINKRDASHRDVISYPGAKLVKHGQGQWYVKFDREHWDSERKVWYANGEHTCYYFERSDKELAGSSDLVEW